MRLQIINNLVNQIDGTIELNDNVGTQFRIVFTELNYKKRY